MKQFEFSSFVARFARMCYIPKSQVGLCFFVHCDFVFQFHLGLRLSVNVIAELSI